MPRTKNHIASPESKRDYHPGLPIQRHRPRCPCDVAESSQPRQPYNIQSLKELWADLIHPRGLATEEFFDYLSNFSSPGDTRVCPQVPRPCFLTGRRAAVRNSFSMALPNSSHARVFASATAVAALRLACRYLSAASGVPQASKARYDSFLSLTASLTASVHQQLRALPPRQAPTTLQPQHRSAASTMEAQNMVHSDSMSPASPGTWSKLSRRCELKLLLAGDSARCSQQTQTYCEGLLGTLASFPTIGANSPPGADQLTALPLSSPGCPERTNNSQDPSPHPKVKGGYPLIHRGKFQYTGTEPGSNYDCYPCPSPLTIGNSRVVESNPSQEDWFQSPCYALREVTFHVPRASFCSRGSDRQGGEPMGRGSHIASSGCARPDFMGRGPANRRSPTCPAPKPGSRRGPR
ncbi:hypothetical protein D4764_12G0007810 [Takifugu flavidus]|uniref:Uncharacterized protein n=1 Tax=Takifugu flavidus TaxID=433684 RepID=A0A5C6PEZ3_9TELE|nr:hypothetical protein D4764_12G0007810 [Takifugu flavidus]